VYGQFLDSFALQMIRRGRWPRAVPRAGFVVAWIVLLFAVARRPASIPSIYRRTLSRAVPELELDAAPRR
jgi:hypothetical protein